MPLTINSVGTSSLMFQRNIDAANALITKSLEQLSTGSRINRASDDVAGFVELSQTNTSLNAYSQAQQNTQNGISFINIANGSLDSISDDLALAKDYALKASSDTISAEQRATYQDLSNSLAEHIVGTLKNTNLNGTNAFADDSASYTKVIAANPDAQPSDIPEQESYKHRLQVGIDSSEYSAVYIDTGVNYGNIIFNLSTAEKSAETMDYIDKISVLTTDKAAELGATTSLLGSISDQQTNAILNLSAAKSTITDVDYAQTTSNLLKGQILLDSNINFMIKTQQMNSTMILNLLYGSGIK